MFVVLALVSFSSENYFLPTSFNTKYKSLLLLKVRIIIQREQVYDDNDDGCLYACMHQLSTLLDLSSCCCSVDCHGYGSIYLYRKRITSHQFNHQLDLIR